MSGRIPRAFIEELIARTNIVDIIQSRVRLNKRGKNYLACCPFHNEKSPSFTVSPEKQFYYCFGCAAHGNVLSFLIDYDRMEFVTAVEFLAAQLGLEIPREMKSSHEVEFAALYDLMQQAARIYQAELKKSKTAIDYLKSRGMTGQIAKTFMIGYAPPDWDMVLQKLGAQEKERMHLTTLGMLIQKNPQKFYDRFRNRIIFPIRDIRGRVIAFGGRTIGEEQPKYLNSPESVVFHKSFELYGLYEAKQKNRSFKQLLIVEGYMDVISLAQYGITYAVAAMGTAINAKHVQKALQHTAHIIFCFDGDEAGRKAAWRALVICLPLLRDGVHIRFLFLPDKEDPDSLVRKLGPVAFEKLIVSSQTLSEVFFQHLKNEISLDTIDGKAQYAKEAENYLKQVPPGVYQKLLFDELSQLIKIPLRPEPAVSQKVVLKKRFSKASSLSTAQLALVLLLRKPSLSDDVEEIFEMKSLQMEGMDLLVKLLAFFRNNSSFSVGQVLSHWEDENERAEIARLSAYPTAVPEEGIKAEFVDALKRLKWLQLNHIAQSLIEKAKHTPLTDEEKQQLQALLIYKKERSS